MMFVFAEAAPHPNPLPAKSGEREKVQYDLVDHRKR
jgi:hypothetical protein